MRHRLCLVSGLVFATLIAGAASASAQTVAAGPYYATPSWDQTLPGSTRFVVLSNFSSDAVLDRETGLVWVKSVPLLFFSWYQAQSYCQTLSVGSRLGWRLPTIQELLSLVDPTSTSSPQLPTGNPFTFAQTAFWSATLSAQFPGTSRNLYFGLDGFGKPMYTLQFDPIDGHVSQPTAWCVRGGLNVNPQ